MAFDMCEGGDGGGDHNPHDHELLVEMATCGLLSLSMNCDQHDACEFHAGLVMQAMMHDAIISTYQKTRSNEMLDAQISVLRNALEKMEEEKANG